MKLKSYFVGTVEAAMELARQELGPEAMLVDSHKSPPEAKHLGDYEVVFASIPASQSRSDCAPNGGTASAQDGGALWSGFGARTSNAEDLFSREVADLRRQIEAMRRTIWRSGLNSAGGAQPFSAHAEVCSMLSEAEVDPQLAQEIGECVQARLAGDPLLRSATPRIESEATAGCREPTERISRPGAVPVRSQLDQALIFELGTRFSVEPTLGCGVVSPRVTVLVGSPGSGKTTTLVKLAVKYGLTNRRPVQLLSMDTYRVAAAAQLRTYAGILGVGFQELETTRALAQALEEHQSKDLILIDTPGYSAADMDSAVDLAAFLAAHPAIDIHLVLPASAKSADLTCAVDRFEIFRPSKLLFTKMDETSTFGPLFSEAFRTGKAISFLATGQQIPEDLEPASKEGIIDRIVRVRP